MTKGMMISSWTVGEREIHWPGEPERKTQRPRPSSRVIDTQSDHLEADPRGDWRGPDRTLFVQPFPRIN